MRNKILFIPFLLMTVLIFSACGNGNQENAESTTADSTKAPKEITDMAGITSYYECPMKCEEKKFSEPGNCPICGMELVLVEVKADSAVTTADTTHQM